MITNQSALRYYSDNPVWERGQVNCELTKRQSDGHLIRSYLALVPDLPYRSDGRQTNEWNQLLRYEYHTCMKPADMSVRNNYKGLLTG